MGEVPYLKEAYDTFHKKGFEIYGVSFDRDRDKVARSREGQRHGMDPRQLARRLRQPGRKGLRHPGHPSNLLIDHEGKIVAKNLRGEELVEKLTELLK